MMSSKRISPLFCGRILSPMSSINVELHIYRLMLSFQKCGVPGADVERKRFMASTCYTLLVRISERLQPGNEIGIAMPLRGLWDTLKPGVCFRYCRAPSFEINREVLVCSVQTRVAQPVSNGGKVDAGTQQMDRGAVTEAVRVKPFIL